MSFGRALFWDVLRKICVVLLQPCDGSKHVCLAWFQSEVAKVVYDANRKKDSLTLDESHDFFPLALLPVYTFLDLD